MNVKQKPKRASKLEKQRLAIRDELWPGVESKLWSRHKRDGFTTVPRALPIIFRIMDDMAPKGKPVSSTYFALWCRSFDEALVSVNSERELAMESGFSGQRAESTWVGRMKILKNLGFIDYRDGPKGRHNYVLLFNPYLVVKGHKQKGAFQEQHFVALLARTQEIGAGDLSDDAI